MARHQRWEDARGEVLVAIMHDQHDFAILRERLWYRIPVESAPKHWPPKCLAFYQTKGFGDEAFAVRYFGHVRDIKRVKRRELFPDELEDAKSDKEYYQVFLERLETLPSPIISARWRRIVFISTTWDKFTEATEINELYDESSLEDERWRELKRYRIPAERQWPVTVSNAICILDFAVFCKSGNIDIEADGDSYHLGDREQAKADNHRNNELTRADWHVLRYTTKQIREESATYCIPQIKGAITQLGALSGEDNIPRESQEDVEFPSDAVAQLSLLSEAIYWVG